MTCTVFLADLRHTYMGVLSSDAMPLNVGYLKAVMDRNLPEVSSRLFVYPERLLAALHECAPEVLMLSNYRWNEQLSLFMAKVAKQIRPETLVVMGGPNIHIEPERRMEFLRLNPQLDVYLLGEADFIATDLVRKFLESGLSCTRLRALEIPSAVYASPDGQMVHHDVAKRERILDEIPSPWLTGIMDEFFDGRLAPLWETNRGCPFTCTFCVQGTGYYNRVTYFAEDRLRDEIHYIGRMIREHSPAMGTLRIADPNYGMYRRDPKLSEYIGEVQKEYGYPSYIDATTGKNRPDRIIESLEKVGGALVLYQAVQSLDEDVLRKVKRQNIKLEAYQALQVHLRGRGLKSSSDLILGLPGESLQVHLDGMMRMIDAGVAKLNNFQCMMLKGTELEKQDSRDTFKFMTRHRVVPKSFGMYDGEFVFEDDEIIVGTDTLPYEDYVRSRFHHLACTMYLNHGRLEVLFRLVESLGGKRSTLFRALVAAMEKDNGKIQEIVKEFINETHNELFTSRETMVDYYSQEENLDRLMKSEIGDNLMYKYAAIAYLYAWHDASRLALRATRQVLDGLDAMQEIEDFEQIWKDFESYETHRFASGSTSEALLGTVELELGYDIRAWVDDGMPRETRAYRLSSVRKAQFRLSTESAREVKSAVETYGLSVSGGTMLVKRIRLGGLERECALCPTGTQWATHTEAGATEDLRGAS